MNTSPDDGVAVEDLLLNLKKKDAKKTLYRFGIMDNGSYLYDIAQQAVLHVYMLPPHCREGVLNWVLHGTTPGHFLTAVIDNDLAKAVQQADNENSQALREYVVYFYNYTPAGCTGSREGRIQWAAAGGIKGKMEAESGRKKKAAEGDPKEV